MKISISDHDARVFPSTREEAQALQERLNAGIVLRPAYPGWGAAVRFAAGLAAAFPSPGVCRCAAVVWDVLEERVVDRAVAEAPASFPYVPGLQAFRELPAALEALRRIGTRAEAVLCAAHGIAHPRRFGMASHIGLAVGLPSVGCAERLITGEVSTISGEQLQMRGAGAPVLAGGEQVGVALYTRGGTKPLYVSPGHLADIESAAELVLRCTGKYRRPEPLRRARIAVKFEASP